MMELLWSAPVSNAAVRVVAGSARSVRVVFGGIITKRLNVSMPFCRAASCAATVARLEELFQVRGELVEDVAGLPLDDSLAEAGEFAAHVRLSLEREHGAGPSGGERHDHRDLDGTRQHGVAAGGLDGKTRAILERVHDDVERQLDVKRAHPLAHGGPIATRRLDVLNVIAAGHAPSQLRDVPQDSPGLRRSDRQFDDARDVDHERTSRAPLW